jgi:glycosyltransferase involved in cell wall biosynthesis
MFPIYIYDTAATDALSKVRGIGRYVQTIKEALGDQAMFTNKLSGIPKQSILLNPFVELLKKPSTFAKPTKFQIGVIHDIIRYKYPEYFPLGVKGHVFSIVNKIIIKNYDAIITDSYASKKDIVDFLHLPSTNVHVLYPALADTFTQSHTTNHEKIAHQYNLPDKYCIYVGDGTWNKNLNMVGQVITKLGIPCVFVGNIFKGLAEYRTSGKDFVQYPHVELQSFNEFASITKDAKNCIFPGYVSDEELVSLYKHAYMNILLSHDEGFGYSYVEAASQGTPSVLADISVFREIAQETAIFVDEWNEEEIAEKILSFWNNQSKHDELGLAALERSKYFSKDTFKEDLLQIINSVTK